MKNKIVSIVAACSLFVSSGVFAADITGIHVDNDTQTVTVSGSLGAEYAQKRVLCQLLQSGIEPASLADVSPETVGSVVKGIYDCGADERGDYSVSFKMSGKSGTYWVVVGGGAPGNTAEMSFDYYNTNDLSVLLADIESARSKKDTAAIKKILDTDINRKMLTVDEMKCGGYSYADLNGNDLSMLALSDTPYTTVGAFVSQYGKMLVVKAFNTASAENIGSLITECDGYLNLVEGPVYKLYTKFDGESLDYVNKKISSKDYTDVDGIAKAICDSVLLRKVFNMENYSELSDFINEYNSRYLNLDISGYSGEAAVNKQLVGREFADMDEFRRAFAEAKGSKSDSTGSGSAGSKPKSGTGSGSGTSVPVIPAQTTQEFSDLGGYDWAKDAVSALAAKKIVSGIGNNMFAPERNVTRREAAKMITLAFGISGTGNAQSFNDVNSDDWAHDYIALLRENSIINGDENNNFRPDDMITREELAAILYRTVKARGITLGGTDAAAEFSDADMISDYARGSVDAMQKGGIITGVGGGNFCPRDNCTRAQTAVMIYRILF